MNSILKQVIKKTPLYLPLRNLVVRRRQKAELAEWEGRGRPVPPPHLVKERVLLEYARRYGLRILVETGTYYGDMVEAMKARFDRVYSIELSRDLYELAVKRFSGADNVELIHGDSGAVLEGVLDKIYQPTLFWLDGHYSAGVTAKGATDTPIMAELRCILNAADRGHVIIIDDARCFGSDPAYPSVEEVIGFITSRRPNVDVAVQGDSIRIAP